MPLRPCQIHPYLFKKLLFRIQGGEFCNLLKGLIVTMAKNFSGTTLLIQRHFSEKKKKKINEEIRAVENGFRGGRWGVICIGYFSATEEAKHIDMLVISIHTGSSDYSYRSELVLLESINITCQ